MQIGVKYCGGCNPRYDRKSFVSRLSQELSLPCQPVGDRIQWDMVLVLCGCANCCASHEAYQGEKGKWIVKDMQDYAEVRDQIAEIANK